MQSGNSKAVARFEAEGPLGNRTLRAADPRQDWVGHVRRNDFEKTLNDSVRTSFRNAIAGMFGGMSVYGMVTKRDLSGMGSFMVMGLWGIILASLVNMFLGNSAIHLTISVLGVIIFTGLTAWDTQKLRMMGMNAPVDDALAMRRGALLGALTLYLDFINMFLMMLRLFGNRE